MPSARIAKIDGRSGAMAIGSSSCGSDGVNIMSLWCLVVVLPILLRLEGACMELVYRSGSRYP